MLLDTFTYMYVCVHALKKIKWNGLKEIVNELETIGTIMLSF